MINSISSCHDCPFCNSDSEYGSSCRISDLDDYGMPSYNEEYVPSECPLIKESVTVKIDDNAIISKDKFRSEKYLQTKRELEYLKDMYAMLYGLIGSDNVTKDYLKEYIKKNPIK